MSEFNFKQIVASAAFDYIGPPFPAWFKKNYNRFSLPDLRGINARQLNGEKYFMRLVFNYKGRRFELPNEPLVSISSTKTIVKTATVGSDRKGTVKEFINTEDYAVSIIGVCVDEDDSEVYPADQVQMINDLYSINDALEVSNNLFFELFGIRKVVIEDLTFDEMQGRSGTQIFRMRGISDTDFYADLNNLNQTKINLLS